MPKDLERIEINQVKIGMFIKLNLNWFEHSFSMNAFKIVNQRELNELKALGLTHIDYVPSKSDVKAEKIEKSDPNTSSAQVAATVVGTTQALNDTPSIFGDIKDAKLARAKRMDQQKQELAKVEAKFVNATNVMKDINNLIFSKPEQVLKEAAKLVDSIAEVFDEQDYTYMYLIQQAGIKEDVYFHSLNVSILAMTLAHEMNCTPAQIREVGLAGMFHDLGKINIPKKITNSKEPLNKAEQHFFEMHPLYGVDIGKKAGLSKLVLHVIDHHHEFLDGSGYPKGLKGDSITMPVRIVSIANVYDNLCNHIDVKQSLTPHEAISSMYLRRSSQFDSAIMATMVKSLGIYPPGTIVQLSNGAIGLVVSINIGESMRPNVLVYDADTPKDKAIVLDLSEESEDIYISGSMRPSTLSSEVFDYLNPRERINYYAAPHKSSGVGQTEPVKK
ncbi:HD-GYP domain-containing protein [Undibacterium sp. Di24W]|uniref:HD-GYP domain-containing protein n=1 Tax=Undibacterium sp. Di24W TaxID=3413033 RepID=UPI003BF0B715